MTFNEPFAYSAGDLVGQGDWVQLVSPTSIVVVSSGSITGVAGDNAYAKNSVLLTGIHWDRPWSITVTVTANSGANNISINGGNEVTTPEQWGFDIYFGDGSAGSAVWGYTDPTGTFTDNTGDFTLGSSQQFTISSDGSTFTLSIEGVNVWSVAVGDLSGLISTINLLMGGTDTVIHSINGSYSGSGGLSVVTARGTVYDSEGDIAPSGNIEHWMSSPPNSTGAIFTSTHKLAAVATDGTFSFHCVPGSELSYGLQGGPFGTVTVPAIDFELPDIVS